MSRVFKYSSDNKRYHTLNYHNYAVFGQKVFKAVIDCGLHALTLMVLKVMAAVYSVTAEAVILRIQAFL